MVDPHYVSLNHQLEDFVWPIHPPKDAGDKKMELLIKYPLLLLTMVLMLELLINYPLHLLTKVLTDMLLMRKTRTRKYL